jgi:hypothetical protein
MSDNKSCPTLSWSPDSADTEDPSFYVCVIGILFHSLFWFSIFTHASLRQWKSMQWVYTYLIIDLLLIIRFLILYGIRNSFACVSLTTRSFICYFESIGDFYLNYLQSYVLLALNICRYKQITNGINIYTIHRRLMIIIHCLIYLLPVLILILEIHFGWAVNYRKHGGSCDLYYPFLSTRILNTGFGYCFPVLLTLLFLFLSLRQVRLTVIRIHTEQILNNRLKHHRMLVFQSIVFYSLWLLLWSPHMISSQYVYISSTVGIVGQLLNYIELTIDPIVISALDYRFWKAWQKTFKQLKRWIITVGDIH